jgi:hypothetical protein
MTSEEDKLHRGFTVVDRRGRSEESERAREPERARGPEPPAGARARAAADELPAIDFSTFVLSLGTSALFHMGLVEDPGSGERPEPDLPLARQTIDTLAMLELKTRGNLEQGEAHLLESLLYDLRMRFVEASR